MHAAPEFTLQPQVLNKIVLHSTADGRAKQQQQPDRVLAEEHTCGCHASASYGGEPLHAAHVQLWHAFIPQHELPCKYMLPQISWCR
jgi:hypothetical protein